MGKSKQLLSSRATAALVLGLLAFQAGPSDAQDGRLDRVREGRVREGRDVPACQTAGGGSRTRANCENRSTVVVRSEREFTIAVETPAPKPTCQASIASGYTQRDTVARVESTIKIEGCSAASGAFTVGIRVRNEQGTIDTLEFAETWERTDERDLALTGDYPIGTNVELVSTRVRSVRCSCTDTEAASEAPETAP
jgi:hypothetical protein